MRGAGLAVLALWACSRGSPIQIADAGMVTDPQNGQFTLEQALDGLPRGGKLIAEIGTNRGVIPCELFPDKAPRTVATFVGLARGRRSWRDPFDGKWVQKQPFYDDLAFHRVIPKYIIQGGDPFSREYRDPNIGFGDPGFNLPEEIVPDLKFDRPGRLALANAKPGTYSGGSQFFITEVPIRPLDGQYTIFGQCDGLEAIQEIARVPVDHPKRNKPLSAVTMRVKILRR